MKPTWGTEDLSDCPEGSFRPIPCANSPVSQAMLACNHQFFMSWPARPTPAVPTCPTAIQSYTVWGVSTTGGPPFAEISGQLAVSRFTTALRSSVTGYICPACQQTCTSAITVRSSYASNQHHHATPLFNAGALVLAQPCPARTVIPILRQRERDNNKLPLLAGHPQQCQQGILLHDPD